ATSAWEDIPTTVSSETRTVSAKITHTSIFALFVASPPPTAVATEAITTVGTAVPINGGLPMDLIMKIIILIIIVIAAVVVIIYFLRKRKGPSATATEPPADEWDIKGLQ
ncbi:MAG: hypothetical protein MUC66_09440, partial [Methanolinea sp.]|nr:hypothetical protein [Methanolinea sp.]